MEKDRDLGSAPLRVGLFIDCYYPMVDGVVHVVDNLARNMIAAGAEVTVFAPTADKKYDDAQLPYRVVRGPSLRVGFMDYALPLLSFSARFKREIRRAKLDVMHIHAPFVSGPIAEKIAKKQGVPVIGTFHSQYKKDFARYLKSRFLQKRLLSHVVKVFDRCDLVLTMTEATEAVARSYGCKAKIALLPNGTNLKETEKTAAAAAEVAARYRENPRQKLLLFVGRLYLLKNLELAIDACARLRDRGFDFKFLLVGWGKDEEVLRRQVRDLSLEERVLFVGRVDGAENLGAYYKACDLLLFPSAYDMDPLVKNEAAAFSLPAILAEGTPAASGVTDGVNGYIAPLGADAFAERIISALSDEAAHAAVRARAHETLYRPWDEIAAEHLRLYREEIARKAAQGEKTRGRVDNPSNLIGIIENTALRLAAGHLCVAGAPLRAERTVPQLCAGRLCTGAGIPQYRKNTASRLAAGRFRVPRQAA